MTDRLASLALGISTSVALSLLVKATTMLVLGLLLVRVMRTARASRRFIVLAWTFALLAVLPVAVAFGPAIPIAVSETRHVVPAHPMSEPAVTGPANRLRQGSGGQEAGHYVGAATVQPESAGGDGAAAVVATMWATGMVVSLVPVLMTVCRLRTLRRTAREWRGKGSPRAHRARILVHEQLSAPMTYLRPGDTVLVSE
jgi:beta-lactamase regulating signal transducer with metallopeptidase domain